MAHEVRSCLATYGIAMMLFGVLALGGCASGIKREKFTGLYEASRAVQSSTEVGVTPNELRGLVQKMATEVAIARDRARTDSEKQLVTAYDEALSVYTDSLELWDVISSLKAQNDVGLPPGALNKAPQAKRIIEKYGLRPTHHGPIEIGVGKPLEWDAFDSQTVRTMWSFGEEKLTRANSLFLAH